MPNDVADMEAYRAKRQADNATSSDQVELPLHGGGGGGPMDSVSLMKAYTDARDDALESRLSAKLDKLLTSSQMWAGVVTVIGGVFTLVTAALAVLAFGGDRFDGGASVSPQLDASHRAQLIVDDNQDAKAALMDQKLDLIIRQTSKK